ncbi:MAG: hypothetical protein JWO56_2930 [Acidobacteria bacterium]|nr:hypothetical protein [Acidobacteriota bacterium]
MRVLEVGRDARTALASATRCDVVMTFSRGEVVETDRGEIVWFDSDPEAFSPRGVLIRVDETPSSAPKRAGKGRADVSPLHDPFLRECERFVAAIRSGTAIADAAAILLGLGPGLTPSGDDFLGGFLAMRHHLGRPATIDPANTHAISRARLAMHMRGEGTRAELRLVQALIHEHDTQQAEATLRQHGHTSGEDFIRGARAARALR